MKYTLSEHQQVIIEQLLSEGGYSSVEEVVDAALSSLDSPEVSKRKRDENIKWGAYRETFDMIKNSSSIKAHPLDDIINTLIAFRKPHLATNDEIKSWASEGRR